MKNEFINISQPNTTGAVEEYKDYNTITKSEGLKDKIYIDKEKANMYAYDTDTESYYGIAGGVIAFPKLYLNPKNGKLIMQLPTQDTPNAFKIQNGHLILIQ